MKIVVVVTRLALARLQLQLLQSKEGIPLGGTLRATVTIVAMTAINFVQALPSTAFIKF